MLGLQIHRFYLDNKGDIASYYQYQRLTIYIAQLKGFQRNKKNNELKTNNNTKVTVIENLKRHINIRILNSYKQGKL